MNVLLNVPVGVSAKYLLHGGSIMVCGKRQFQNSARDEKVAKRLSKPSSTIKTKCYDEQVHCWADGLY